MPGIGRAPLAAIVSLVVLLSPVSAEARGVRPKAVFRTPGSSAYCSIGPTNQDSFAPQLFCWAPGDGWGAAIGAHDSRAFPAFYTRPPRIVHGYAPLVGYRPRARTLSVGVAWALRCATPYDYRRCGPHDGSLAFRCTSGAARLTCVNAARHGFWIGRSGGHGLV